ncbi:MAG: hypothetical protein MUQ20_02095, partial [Deltaproteobacteria bacterium]|nr:hypothetical protein [Deltaproteobacteria bacterium]
MMRKKTFFWVTAFLMVFLGASGLVWAAQEKSKAAPKKAEPQVTAPAKIDPAYRELGHSGFASTTILPHLYLLPVAKAGSQETELASSSPWKHLHH